MTEWTFFEIFYLYFCILHFHLFKFISKFEFIWGMFILKGKQLKCIWGMFILKGSQLKCIWGMFILKGKQLKCIWGMFILKGSQCKHKMDDNK